jgi:ribosomal protein S18 acetylase RimI-like enzyme
MFSGGFLQPDNQSRAGIRSLSWATDIDVLPPDATATRSDGFWTVRSPSNPTHYWGNFLLFDDPPRPGDGARWERTFARAMGGPGAPPHRSFAWDRTDGSTGAAEQEFVSRGYALERTVGLLARPRELRYHRRASREVAVRPLDPAPGADGAAWDQIVELWVAGRQGPFDEQEYRDFARLRLEGLRTLFAAGRGAWWVAELDHGAVVGSLGIVVTGTRARFQSVDTAAAHRRRGICSRLVVEAAQRTAAAHPVSQFVICADPGYHALGLYETLGFADAERVAAVLLRPDGSSS